MTKYRLENFANLPIQDQYECPQEKRLKYPYTKKIVMKNGYETQRRVYGGAACHDYAVMAEYTQSKYECRSWVGVELLKMKKLAYERLLSSRGKEVRALSPIEKEAVFGRLKHNWGWIKAFSWGKVARRRRDGLPGE